MWFFYNFKTSKWFKFVKKGVYILYGYFRSAYEKDYKKKASKVSVEITFTVITLAS